MTDEELFKREYLFEKTDKKPYLLWLYYFYQIELFDSNCSQKRKFSAVDDSYWILYGESLAKSNKFSFVLKEKINEIKEEFGLGEAFFKNQQIKLSLYSFSYLKECYERSLQNGDLDFILERID